MQRENESWSAYDQPIREENGFDKEKAEETYVWLVGLFWQETLLILVTSITRGMEWKTKHKRFITFIVLLREC